MQKKVFPCIFVLRALFLSVVMVHVARAQAVGPIQVGVTPGSALPAIMQRIQKEQTTGAFVSQGEDPFLGMPVVALVSPAPVAALGGMTIAKVGYRGGIVRFVRLGGDAAAGSSFFANLSRQVPNTKCADHLPSDELVLTQRDVVCVTPVGALWMRDGGSEVWVADRETMRFIFERILLEKDLSRIFASLEAMK
jgi:hypothetical protein